MRTIIAGSRDFTGYETLEYIMSVLPWKPTLILSGGAKGADRLGEVWASAHDIPLERYPAQWDKYGKGAGFKRNFEMAENAEALISLWDGESRGTKHMIETAKRMGLVVYVWNYVDHAGSWFNV